MTIQDIYEKYDIMPNLQTHMLRVAAVAKIICDSLIDPVDTDNVVSAMLLHDMGNILKFNLTLYPVFLKPQGLLYWQAVQKTYRKKYGNDEHDGTAMIARELCVSDRIFELLSSVGFTKAKENLLSADMSKKICSYADQRVTPFGITDLETRIQEGRARYAKNKPGSTDNRSEESFTIAATSLMKIEEAIFARSRITPGSITNEQIDEVIASTYLTSIIFAD